MTSHSMDKTLNRIRLVKNQIAPSDDCLKELSTFSFDLEKVAQEVRNLRPELFFKTQTIVEKNYEGRYVHQRIIFIRGPGNHLMEKDELRLQTNKLVIATIQSLIKEHGLTAKWITENLDEFTRSLMGTG